MNAVKKPFSSDGFIPRWVFKEQKARAGFAFAFVCLGVVGVTSYQSVNRLRENAEWATHTEEVISSLYLLLLHVTDAESFQRGYVKSGAESHLGPYHDARRYIDADLQSLRNLTADNAVQQRRLDDVGPLIAKRMARLDGEAELRRSQGFTPAQAADATGVGMQLHDQIRRLVGDMETTEQGLLLRRQADSNSSSAVAEEIIVGGSILALGVAAVALVAVGRDIVRRRAHVAQAAFAGRLSGIGSWTAELPGLKLTWSDQVCVILGVPPGSSAAIEEALRHYAPEFCESVKGAIGACARNGAPFRIESQLFRANGRRVWVSTLGEAERDSAGVIRRVRGSLQDVTESRRTDENVIRLAAIVESSSDAIFSSTMAGILTSWNPAAELMFGYSSEEIIGQPLRTLVPPDCLDEEQEILAGIARGDLARQFETVRIRNDGRRFDVSATISPIKESGGRIVGASTIVRDITERERSLEALRESEMRFRELAENIQEVFWVADPDVPRKLYISPAYEKIWGRTCQSAYDSPDLWIDSVRPEDRDRVLQALSAKQRLGTYDVEYRILRPDGAERWVRDRAFPVRDASGTIKRWVGIAEDITQYRVLEDQFRQAQKMEAIGTLAGGIAHDFNNILAAINGYADLALMILKENPEVREHLDEVLRASSRAADLVQQILAFSRQQQSERLPIQLRHIVDESLRLLRATLPSTIGFKTSISTDVPTVLADATQVHQVMMNLGTNAWHAMKDHPGRLEVRLERCVVDAAHAEAQSHLRPGVYARLSVSDTGSGMDHATLRRIFEPFFTTKSPGNGTGLGLSVVHGIMESHGGAVTVHSQPGEGTVFHLYFPAHAGDAAVAATEEGLVPRGHGECILVVDDEESLIRLGRKTLTALGYGVETTTQPAAAITMVRADPQRFALVLTDQTMPGMTGLVLADQLLKIRPTLPIILTTGYSASLAPETVKAAGIFQLLLKPTTFRSLGTAVDAALSAHPPR